MRILGHNKAYVVLFLKKTQNIPYTVQTAVVQFVVFMTVGITTLLFPFIIHFLTLSWFPLSRLVDLLLKMSSPSVYCSWLWPWVMLWLWAWCLWLFLTGPQSSKADVNHLVVGEVSGCSLCAMTQPCNPGIFSRLWLHMGKEISTDP